MRAPAIHDIERIIEIDFVRATEAAALNAAKWLGKGDKNAADAAACDAIRGMFDLMDVCGEVVIGEGIKDDAPGIFLGEQLGKWTPGALKFDIALDPVDGTTNCAKGMPNSISVLCAASPEADVKQALKHLPSFYSAKLAYGPRVKNHMARLGVEQLKLENPIEENLEIIARALGKRVQDLTVVILDRPRHDALVTKIRASGAGLRLIGDGDIAAAIAPSLPDSGVDLYVGIGGSPEAVVAAAAIKCLGGEIQCKMAPRDEAERAQLLADGHEEQLREVYYADDLAHGKNIIFCATGISDSSLVPGIKNVNGRAITHSILMRAKHKTVRYITTHHDLSQKTIRLRSSRSEEKL
ncbi:MAG: class II fructose-bisphosphatase [Verrucomicrobia bacterium]|nr:class II fructose-bisphosphatase [Verrucomicrobiota bacterium]